MKIRPFVVALILLTIALGAALAMFWPTARRRALARVEALNGTYVEQVDEQAGGRRLNLCCSRCGRSPSKTSLPSTTSGRSTGCSWTVAP